jgi:hypothetical protein
MVRRRTSNGTPVTNAQLAAEIRALNWKIVVALVLGQIIARLPIVHDIATQALGKVGL